MPTPVGHALGGLAAAFFANATARNPALTPQILLASVVASVAPDLDILAGHHRSYTHSVGAVAVVGVASWLALRGRTPKAAASTAAVTAAYASHLVLDWLGKDTAPPVGLTILWPFSSSYFSSGLDLFGEVSRRYWLPSEFIFGNLGAVGWEVLILLPVFIIAWTHWSKRTLRKKEEGKRKKAPRHA